MMRCNGRLRLVFKRCLQSFGSNMWWFFRVPKSPWLIHVIFKRLIMALHLNVINNFTTRLWDALVTLMIRKFRKFLFHFSFSCTFLRQIFIPWILLVVFQIAKGPWSDASLVFVLFLVLVLRTHYDCHILLDEIVLNTSYLHVFLFQLLRPGQFMDIWIGLLIFAHCFILPARWPFAFLQGFLRLQLTRS